MQGPIHEFFKSLRGLSLSDAERIRSRNELSHYMREHPLQAPFWQRVRARTSAAFHAVSGTSLVRGVSVAFALVLVFGVGTSYAAIGSLPGEPLYAIKVRVAEPLRSALTTSPVEKAEWEASRIAKRLEEAEVLVAEGRLDSEKLAQVETHINDAARKYEAAVATMPDGAENAAVAASVHSEVEAALLAHEHVLSVLSEKSSDDGKRSVAPLIAKVRERAEKARANRERGEVAIAARGGTELRAIASSKRDDATERVAEVRAMAVAIDDGVEASSSASTVSSTTEIVDEARAKGEDALEEGRFGEAFGTFQAVIRAAAALKVHLDAEKRLNTDLDEKDEVRETDGDEGTAGGDR